MHASACWASALRSISHPAPFPPTPTAHSTRRASWSWRGLAWPGRLCVRKSAARKVEEAVQAVHQELPLPQLDMRWLADLGISAGGSGRRGRQSSGAKQLTGGRVQVTHVLF